MPHQRTRKKKKKRERHQELPQQEQQMVSGEEVGLQETEEFPQRLKIRKRRRKTGIERLSTKASKHLKVILIAILWFIIALFIVYRFTS